MKKKDVIDSYKDYNQHLASSYINLKSQYDIYLNYYKKNLLRYLPQNKERKIVDIGCGNGHMLYFLKKYGYINSSGIDINQENVEKCNHLNLHANKDDLFRYLKKNKDLEVVIFNNVLEHFENKKIIKIINLALESLNSGGKLLIIIPNCSNMYGIITYFSDITHKSPLNERSFRNLLEKTEAKNYFFRNLIIYPNIYILDSLLRLYQESIFIFRKINNLLNGQKPFKVQSKNLLLVIEK